MAVPVNEPVDVYDFTPGSGPLLVSIPHSGTYLPDDIATRLTDDAQALPDTDWHVDRLYDFLGDLGVSRLKANVSRYVIDLNRPGDNSSLYPGKEGTGLVPTTTFDGEALYKGAVPDQAEIKNRMQRYWRPYHERLQAEVAAKVTEHGFAVIWDAHSIRSHVPRLFEGRLPDMNLGTASGKSASWNLSMQLMKVAGEEHEFSSVLNGRFRGGYITRQYGRPDKGVHAVQMELAQATYMDEDPPFAFDEAQAEKLRAVLRKLIDCAQNFDGISHHG